MLCQLIVELQTETVNHMPLYQYFVFLMLQNILFFAHDYLNYMVKTQEYLYFRFQYITNRTEANQFNKSKRKAFKY